MICDAPKSVDVANDFEFLILNPSTNVNNVEFTVFGISVNPFSALVHRVLAASLVNSGNTTFSGLCRVLFTA